MKYSVVAKKDAKSHAVEEKIKERLQSSGWIYDKAEPQLVICVGGDGTLLYGVHQYLHRISEVNFLGIHTGTLGFFTDYTEEELEECLHDVLEKEPVIFEDGEFFETCRGSGICLSTQAGSTAYNRSLGGAVIDCGLSLMQLAEITAIQHSKHRSLGNPYIMMKNRHVTMKSETFDTAILCYDHLNVPLEATKEIYCEMSDRKVRFARYRHYSYLRRLKNLY